MTHFEPRTDTYPTARKTHRCSGCYGDIRPGQQYHRLEGKCRESLTWVTWKLCGRCVPCPANITGGFIRPAAAFSRFSDYGGGDAEMTPDSKAIRAYGQPYHYDDTGTWEAIMVPLVGLMGWEVV